MKLREGHRERRTEGRQQIRNKRGKGKRRKEEGGRGLREQAMKAISVKMHESFLLTLWK